MDMTSYNRSGKRKKTLTNNSLFKDVTRKMNKSLSNIVKDTEKICKISNDWGKKVLKFNENNVNKELRRGLSQMRPFKENELFDIVDMVVSENEVYDKRLWDKSLVKDTEKNKFKTKSGEEIKILEKYNDEKTGLDALVIERKDKSIEVFFQGSMPAIHYPITAAINSAIGNNKEETKILNKKNTASYKKDWGANIFGNLTKEQILFVKAALSTNFVAYAEFLKLEKEFSSKEKGTPKQLEKALEICKNIQKKYGNRFMRVSGHSLGGAEAIYVASHLNLEAIAVDPAPVNNPGRYLNNNKILVIIPNNGEGMLNKIVPNKNGGKTFQFSPLNKCLPDLLDEAGNLISGQKTSGKLPAITVEKGKNIHEVSDNDMKKVAIELNKKMGWSK